MASSSDFKKLYEKYQDEGVKHGISIVQYCQMNGVIYQQFERWYKKYRSGVVTPVEIVDKDGLLSADQQVASPVSSQEESVPPGIKIAHVNLVFSNGLQVNHHNISYPAFRQLVEKLEGLC